MPRKTSNTYSSHKDLEEISKSITSILTHKHSSLSLSYLYNCMNNLVNNSCTNKLRDTLQNHLDKQFSKQYNSLSKTALVNPLVIKFSKHCSYFASFLKILPKLYSRYDESLAENSEYRTEKILFTKFKEKVLNQTKVVDLIIKSMIDVIEDARTNRIVSGTANLRQIIELFYEYKNSNCDRSIFENFMASLKESTKKKYENEYNSSENFVEFLKRIKELLDFEENLLLKAIFKDEEDVNEILMIAHESAIFKNTETFANQKDFQVPPIYSALQDKNLLRWLIRDSYLRFHQKNHIMCEFIPKICEFMTKDIKSFEPKFSDHMKLNDKITQIHEIIKKVLSQTEPFEFVFCSQEHMRKKSDDPNFDMEKEAREKFEKAITAGWNIPAFNIVENFVQYIDFHIKNEKKRLSKTENENFERTCARFFRYTEDKVGFCTTYEQALLQRLIKFLTKFDAEERMMIETISKEKQPEFMKGYKDLKACIDNSAQIDDDFKKQIMNTKIEWPDGMREVQFSPIVFNKNHYKLYIIEQTKIPEFLSPVHDRFIQFYQEKNKSMTLMLLADTSTVQSKWRIPKNSKSNKPETYVLTTDILTSKILSYLHKNQTEKVSVQDIIMYTQEEKPLVKKCIAKLLGLQICVREKTVKTTEKQQQQQLSDTDLIMMNKEFHMNGDIKRIVIPTCISVQKQNKQIVTAETESEKVNTTKAFIVRTLKQMNTIDTDDLINLTIDYLRRFFVADKEFIKKILGELDNDGTYFKKLDKGMLEYIR
ncbi:hypothetical protein TVAG_154700 [Trichomonas vaginalis G3]|uniref:Cullin family profile domain-containing protein n=1 Tax=Trichomonas vaginalis (strain ATCC PRA-98 / G3) TaxID=412133 RepID=A2F261_TRIV3|nr:Cullin family [Trichomonas vaginalis G3]EAY01000.1 hypothetical protein TVAG_154700 [Trichomonas vaginalis G3]KAI5548065.1 Cullin family [Trichomonas vaginalis G3]|eukprot:XP_001313897.1 hypothetical protein [Trichomonas vaginalis G3]